MHRAEWALTPAAPLVRASEIDRSHSKDAYQTKEEVIGNSWNVLFAGHESTGNTTHFALTFLAIALESQARLQADIDNVLSSHPVDEWSYETDMSRLYQSMGGAVMNETLRLCPPIIDIPKVVRETEQTLTWDKKTVTVPPNTIIHLSACSIGRNPRYWPNSPSRIIGRAHDLDDFVPERWLQKPTETIFSNGSDSEGGDGSKKASFEAGDGLFVPSKGAFVPFSEGARSCPGKRFAQVEIMAVLAVIFKTYTVELDVREWASDVELEAMGSADRRKVYEKARAKARTLIRESEIIIALKMHGKVPVRFIERGKERFMGVFI
jgi:cytochrome P450